MDKGFTLCPTCGTQSGAAPDAGSKFFWDEIWDEAWHDYDQLWHRGMHMSKESEWKKFKLEHMKEMIKEKYYEEIKEREWNYKKNDYLDFDREYTRRVHEYIYEPYESPILEECEGCFEERQPKVLIARPHDTVDHLVRRYYRLIKETPKFIGPNDIKISSVTDLIKKIEKQIDFDVDPKSGFSWFTSATNTLVWYKYPVFGGARSNMPKKDIIDTAMKCGRVLIYENLWEDNRIINDNLCMRFSTESTIVNPGFISGTSSPVPWIHVIYNPKMVKKIRADRIAALKKKIENGEVPMELVKEYRDFLRTLIDVPWVWRDPKKKTRYDWFKEILLLVQMCDAVVGDYSHANSPTYNNLIEACLPYTKGLMRIDNEYAVNFGRWLNRETNETRDQIGARVLDLGT